VTPFPQLPIGSPLLSLPENEGTLSSSIILAFFTVPRANLGFASVNPLSALGIPSPHPYCSLETPGLLWTNVIMDTLIAASYAIVFSCLTWMAADLRKLTRFNRYLWIFTSFGLFILACGGTHLMDALNLWWPHFGLASAIRISCAVASVPTAIVFAKVTPSLARNIRSFVEVLASTQEQRDSAQGALTAAQAIVAERRKAASEIAFANEQLHAVMNSTSECILQIDHQWKILYGNREAASTLPDFRLGGNLWNCFPALSSAKAEVEIRNAMQNRSEGNLENYYEPNDRWYNIHTFPTRRGMSIFSSDITAEKKLEESLCRERLIKELHIEAMSHLAGGLAHEISNPLAIIHARASDLQDLAAAHQVPSAAKVEATCGSIVRTADRAIRILRGLKGLSRDATSDPMEFSDVRSICRESVDLQSSRFASHHVEMRIHLDSEVPLVLCRDVQIGQIVTNLLNNAFDAIVQSESTERWISMDLGTRESSVYVKVVDSGPGISQSNRDRIMDPFFTTKKPGFGTGVGLSLSRAIANDHGGSMILCDGVTNTTFELLLPISQTPELAALSGE
jgi:signal transduction histidine kinase